MKFFTTAVALAATLSAAYAQNGYKGFNSGSTFSNGQNKQQVDFAYEMRAAQQLPGTNGAWTSMRLYTMIQGGTTNTPISAIPAAIETKSTLLLGLWASAPADQFQNEVTALTNAINQYGTAFTDLVTGISVGSEDLYRNSVNEVGASPQQIVDYVSKVRSAIAGTSLAGKPVGHVDTWNAFTNSANSAVISAIDFLGMDAYPYYQTSEPGGNGIGNANATFWKSYTATQAVAQGKPVWVTETGWPIIGDTLGQAVAGTDNAEVYWKETICGFTAKGINMYYFQLQSAQGQQVNPDWGIKPAGDVVQEPVRFDVSC
ncbi:GPI-anchored cell wall beta-1,3-endoglucanase EglC [Bimuria novae-zelandiae CBS 107.79]|uniref:Probable glucan endo-1,3-beta-glucosidase eglC n=1 Tax=Bimuria novae-zelandiae CBS 107.79 TaxID=1447943 RepID=A0A6A5UJJ3_9PLEO|nr:GPI-anchored cell wall beta-1,3-endoglucanase EglC [Bimuria novae-zelandiae CBS 107.79]